MGGRREVGKRGLRDGKMREKKRDEAIQAQ